MVLKASLFARRISAWSTGTTTDIYSNNLVSNITACLIIQDAAAFNNFLLTYFRISYPIIQIATQSGKSVYLTVTKDTNDSVVLLFKLISNRAASGLYRAITETHAFYR